MYNIHNYMTPWNIMTLAGLTFNQSIHNCTQFLGTCVLGGARGVMVIVVGIGHDDTSSNPGRY